MDEEQQARLRQESIEVKGNLDMMLSDSPIFTNGRTLFSRDNYVSENNAAFQLNKEAIKQAMMLDRANAEVLKNVYPDIYREAEAYYSEKQQIANYGVFQKIKHKVTREERDKARNFVTAMKSKEQELFEKRKEVFRERRSFYNTKIGDQEEAYRESKEEKEAQYEEMLGMTSERIRDLGPVEHMRGLNEAFSERNDHVILVRKVLDKAGKKEEKRQTVIQKMKRFCLLSKGEMRRIKLSSKMMDKVDDANRDEPFEAMTRFRQSFDCSKLALLVEREGDTDDELVQKTADARLNLNIIARNKHGSSEEIDEREKAFQDTVSLVDENYSECISMASTNPEMFVGHAHPESLLYSWTLKSGNDYASGSKKLELLYLRNRKAKITLDVISELKRSDIFKNPEKGLDDTPLGRRQKRKRNEARDYILGAEAFLKAFREYTTGVFHSMDEWDNFYMSESGTKDMSKAPGYYGHSLTELVGKYEKEADDNR